MTDQTIRIGINGCGRIGRMVLRASMDRPEVEVVAINDLLPPDHLAYLLGHDSVHGAFPGEVRSDDGGLVVNSRAIPVSRQAEPGTVAWRDLDVDVVVEASGRFLTRDLAAGHIASGARKVVMSAPPKDDTPVFVPGVNETAYRGQAVVSNASCTTNCVAPLAKVLHDAFGIEQALMMTVHAATASQNTVDGAAKSDWRFGRSVFDNIIPAATGAAKMVGRVLPELAGRIDGMAARVPVANVSMLDLTCRFGREATLSDVNNVLREAAGGALKGIVDYCDAPVVSSDLRGNPHSCVFDAGAGISLEGGMTKLIAWYDNEWGYANRCLDMSVLIGRAPD